MRNLLLSIKCLNSIFRISKVDLKDLNFSYLLRLKPVKSKRSSYARPVSDLSNAYGTLDDEESEVDEEEKMTHFIDQKMRLCFINMVNQKAKKKKDPKV